MGMASVMPSIMLGPSIRSPHAFEDDHQWTSAFLLIAGTTFTIIFAASALLMLLRAYRTRELTSYSRGNIIKVNTGKVVHSVYVYSLLAGCRSVCCTASTWSPQAIMLVWCPRYEWHPQLPVAPSVSLNTPPDAPFGA